MKKKKPAAKKATSKKKPAAKPAAAKKPTPVTKPAAKVPAPPAPPGPRRDTYTPRPIEGTGWAPFRYPPR